MKRYVVMAVLVCSGTLVLAPMARGYDYTTETTGCGAMGEGIYWAEYWPVSEVGVDGLVNYPETGYCWGFAYKDRRLYVTEWDPLVDPPIQADVNCVSEAKAGAWGYVETSDYFVESVGQGYCGSTRCQAYATITEPDDADYDVDWFQAYVPISYVGATVNYGDLAFGKTDFYYTSNWVECWAQSDSQALARVRPVP